MADAQEGRNKDKGSNGSVSRHDLRILNAIRQVIRAADIDSRKLAAEHRITSPQLMCLLAVVEKGSITAIDVSRRIHLSPSTLVGVLDRLEAKGLIQRERNADDRREITVKATKAGQKLASQTPFPLQFSLGKALGQLTERQRDEVAQWMERLVELMGISEIDASPMLEIASLSKDQTS